jgi:hypothetical protein
VNEQHSPPVEAESNKLPSPLVERLDPSIGELSTVVGAMMSELLRRALRGSVRQIDDELQGHVAQKVDSTIAQRLPAIEQSAAEIAEKAARGTATEVAIEQVHALEERTKDADREIATRVEESVRTVAALAEEKARALAGDIEAAERRAKDAAQAELTRQVEELVQRSRKTTGGIKDRLDALASAVADLSKQLADEAGERKAETLALRADMEKRLGAAMNRLHEQERAWRSAQERLRRELTQVNERNAEMESRLRELERPRGLRALWTRWFGRRPAASSAKEDQGDQHKDGEQA